MNPCFTQEIRERISVSVVVRVIKLFVTYTAQLIISFVSN